MEKPYLLIARAGVVVATAILLAGIAIIASRLVGFGSPGSSACVLAGRYPCFLAGLLFGEHYLRIINNYRKRRARKGASRL